MELSPELIEWCDRVAGRAMRGMPPSVELDDLRQIARVKALERLPHYDPDNPAGAPLEGYLYPAVYHACRAVLRRREGAWNTALAIKDTRPAAGNLEADTGESRMSNLLRFLIRVRLTHAQQFVILQHNAGATAGQIAKRLGVPRSRVLVLLEMSMRKLRLDMAEVTTGVRQL